VLPIDVGGDVDQVHLPAEAFVGRVDEHFRTPPRSSGNAKPRRTPR
jgi:hypothetical protein